MTLELTLAAALRDADSPRAEARNMAIRNLVPAYLDQLNLPSPTFNAMDRSPIGEEILHRLRRCAESDPLPQIRGLALIGIAQIGSSSLLDLIATILNSSEDHSELNETVEAGGFDHGKVFVRECALISCGLLAQAAAMQSEKASEAQEVYRATCHWIEQAAQSPSPELRFQALTALVELRPNQAEKHLLEAWAREQNLQVQSHILHLFGQLSAPLGPQTQSVLCDFLEEHALSSCPGAIDAALCLAAAGRKEAGEPLLQALGHREYRDRALEALAALGPVAPSGSVAQLRRWSDRFLLATATSVRAAYALARISPEDGMARLHRFRKHPRKSVREAVADAFKALALLKERKNSPSNLTKSDT